jgi:redox-sensitive bicupin YhaK (pirin superfamily)
MMFRAACTRGVPPGEPPYLKSKRTFSFPDYYDARYINFSDLQTINDDRMDPHHHVPWHMHKNMEIFGYVVDGFCFHTDSLGNKTNIQGGSVQRMSAGSGISHTEGNSTGKTNRYLQIWIRPNVLNTSPKHEFIFIKRKDKLNTFFNITDHLPILQDAKFFCGVFTTNFKYELNKERKYYLYVVKGGSCFIKTEENLLTCLRLAEGDGLSIEKRYFIELYEMKGECEILLFDLR